MAHETRGNGVHREGTHLLTSALHLTTVDRDATRLESRISFVVPRQVDENRRSTRHGTYWVVLGTGTTVLAPVRRFTGTARWPGADTVPVPVRYAVPAYMRDATYNG